MSARPERPVASESPEYQQTLSRIACSVAVVTTAHEDSPVGCTVTSVVSLSLDPPLVLICLDKQKFLCAAILEHGAFAVNVLSDEQDELAACFAGMPHHTDTPGRAPERFDGIGWNWAGDVPVLTGTVARLQCRLWTSYDGGDHLILVGEVSRARAWPGRQPLLRFDRGWARVTDRTRIQRRSTPEPARS